MGRVPNWREYDDDDEDPGTIDRRDRRDALRDKKLTTRPQRMKD